LGKNFLSLAEKRFYLIWWKIGKKLVKQVNLLKWKIKFYGMVGKRVEKDFELFFFPDVSVNQSENLKKQIP